MNHNRNWMKLLKNIIRQFYNQVKFHRIEITKKEKIKRYLKKIRHYMIK